MADPKTDTLAWALLGVQKEMPAIKPNAKNPHFKNEYVSLDHLLSVVLPILHKHNLVLSQYPTSVSADHGMTTVLLHAPSGEKLEFTTPLILDRATSQGHGSAITYARRYALAAALGISSEKDDDGEEASKAPEKPSKPRSGAAVPRTDKMRVRIQELASEADKLREVDPGTTWAEVVEAIKWRYEQLDDKVEGEENWDTLSEPALVFLGNELKAYVADGSTGITFYEHVTVPF